MSKDFDPEKFCGIEEYGTSVPGVGGVVKTKPEDFVVEEVPLDLGEGGNFLLCKLKKENMTTFEALERLSSELRVSRKRIGYAGLKDKRACTTQFVTLEGLEEEDIQLDNGRLGVEAVKKVPRPLRTGDLKENSFHITIRDIDISPKNCKERLENLREEINEGVPNYYGMQRFGGQRPVTHLVGRELLGRNYRRAVETYLFKTFPTEKEEFRKARKKLEEERNYEKALDYFPRPLTYERDLIRSITETGPSSQEDWIEVFRTFPKNLRRLFVHAYQSYVFNRALSHFFKQENVSNFPGKVPGYGTDLSSSDFDGYLKKVLSEDNVSLNDFRFKETDGLSSEGTVRAALMKPGLEIEKVEELEGKTAAQVSFSLKPGRYATVVVRELTKKPS